MENFLKEHQLLSGAIQPNVTRFGASFNAKYYFSDMQFGELLNIYSLMFDERVGRHPNLNLTHIIPEYAPLTIDFDLKAKLPPGVNADVDACPRIVTDAVRDEIFAAIYNALVKFYGIEEISKHKMYYMPRAKSEYTEDNTTGTIVKGIKDGIHIVIPGVIVRRDSSYKIFREITGTCKYPVDTSVNLWFIYGNGKDGNVYLCDRIVSLDGRFIPDTAFAKMWLPRELSLHGRSSIHETKLILDMRKIDLDKIEGTTNLKFTDAMVDFYREVVMKLSQERACDADKWRHVVWCLAGASRKDKRFFQIAADFHAQKPGYDPQSVVDVWSKAFDGLDDYGKRFYRSFDALFRWLKEDAGVRVYDAMMARNTTLVLMRTIEKVAKKSASATPQPFPSRGKKSFWSIDSVARILYRLVGHLWRVIPQGGTRLTYWECIDGIWQKHDNPEFVITRYCLDRFDKVLHSAIELYLSINTQITPEVQRFTEVAFALSSFTKSSPKTIRDIAQFFGVLCHDSEETIRKNLNRNTHTLGFKKETPYFKNDNNLYDLSTGQERPAEPEDYVGTTFPCTFIRYDPAKFRRDAEVLRSQPGYDRKKKEFLFKDLDYLNERMLKIHETTFPDPTVRKCVLDILSRALVSRSSQQFFIFHGAGSNGKSKYVESIIRGAFDSGYCSRVDIAAFTNNHVQDPSKPAPFWADFEGRKIVTTSEPLPGTRFNESVIKQITGHDPINFRNLFEGNRTIELGATYIACTNTIPFFDGSQVSMRRRIVIIPFEATFCDPKDPVLSERAGKKFDLLADMDQICEAIVNSGIFISYLIHHYHTHMEGRQLVLPEKILSLTKRYFDDNDTIQNFVRTILEKTGNDTDIIPKNRVWMEFLNYTKSKRRVNQYGEMELMDKIAERIGFMNVTDTGIIGYRVAMTHII